jgi:hypothetical protein
MSIFAQIYADDIASTFTPATTDFERVPGSTLWVGQTMDFDGIRPEPANTTGIRMVTGFRGKGTWAVGWCGSWTANQGNKLYHIAMFKNGTKIDPTSRERTIGTAGSFGVAAGSGYVVMKESTDVLDIRVKSTVSAQVTISHLSFTAQLITTSTNLGTV